MKKGTKKERKESNSFKALFGERRKAALYGVIDISVWMSAYCV